MVPMAGEAPGLCQMLPIQEMCALPLIYKCSGKVVINYDASCFRFCACWRKRTQSAHGFLDSLFNSHVIFKNSTHLAAKFPKLNS